MRVLWLCNIMLPVVAEHLHMESSYKEGWLTGLSNMILSHQKENDIELGVCFPVEENLKDFSQVLKVKASSIQNNFKHNKKLQNVQKQTTGAVKQSVEDSLRESFAQEEAQVRISAYGFYENIHTAETYDQQMEVRMKQILADFQPDVVHCFGTEYPHTLAMTRAFGRPERTLIGIQGLCAVYANHFRADLPDKVWNRTTFRDRLKQDNLRQQHEKYVMRGAYEVEAIQNVKHITGRTSWDRKYAQEWNPQAQYHFMNETLRSNFYEGQWTAKNCKPHSIFLSQGDYPIKGLHYMIQAMPDILRKYPDAEIYVAGNSIIKTAEQKGIDGMKGRLKLESYGLYILDLMKQTGMSGKVHFLGKLNAQEMKQQYLKSHVFVCPSSIENSPNSVGEAMLLGVPTVAANVGGISSIFTNGMDGVLYPAGDTRKLSEAVILMFDGSRVNEFGRNARDHARVTHNPEQNYHRLLEIYEKIQSGQNKK